MNLTRKLLVMAGLASCFFVLSGISGCDESKDIQNWVDHVDKLRVAALKQAEIKPYRNDQYNALKAYFAEINQMALALKNDAGLIERFNKAFGQTDPNAYFGPSWPGFRTDRGQDFGIIVASVSE